MKQLKGMLIGALITFVPGIALAIIGICMHEGGARNGMFVIAAVFALTAVCVLFVTYKYYNENKEKIKKDIEWSKRIKKEKGEIQNENEFREKMVNRYVGAVGKIGELYAKTDYFTEVGFAKFVSAGLEFKIEGKFAAVKDFKGKAGDHLAFEIRSTELSKMPEGYDDVCDYESIGFRIDIGYFDESPLSDYENDNGVVVDDISDMPCGKEIGLVHGSGYNFQVFTVEMDEAEIGHIKVIKWDDVEKIISFKVAVAWGLHDIIAGTVSLTQDTHE